MLPSGPTRRRPGLPAWGLLVALATGCAGSGSLGVGPTHDLPVPPDEPREAASLQLSLPAGPQCEERFDLELYQDRGIDLVTWDDGEGCRDRRVVIRYLPRRLGREALLARVRSLSVAGSVRETATAAPETSP